MQLFNCKWILSIKSTIEGANIAPHYCCRSYSEMIRTAWDIDWNTRKNRLISVSKIGKGMDVLLVLQHQIIHAERLCCLHYCLLNQRLGPSRDNVLLSKPVGIRKGEESNPGMFCVYCSFHGVRTSTTKTRHFVRHTNKKIINWSYQSLGEYWLAKNELVFLIRTAQSSCLFDDVLWVEDRTQCIM